MYRGGVRVISSLKKVTSSIPRLYQNVELGIPRAYAIQLLNDYWGEAYNAAQYDNETLQSLITSLYERGEFKLRFKIKGIYNYTY